jgi:hypothetical protein
MSLHHCYACTFGPGHVGPELSWRDIDRMNMYEECLEAVEDFAKEHDGKFTKSGVWRHNSFHTRYQGGRFFGPPEYAMLTNVIRDLHQHGLIRCLHRDKAGRCRLWTTTPRPKVVI